MKKFFYIITRDGQIFEIEFSEEKFRSSIKEWQNGGLLVFQNQGIGVNAVDISKILSEDQYQNFIDSSQPKQFIKNGAWYDIKERSKPIRYEKWRQEEIEEKKKMQIKGETRDSMTKEEIRNWFAQNKPELIKEIEKINKI